jgi:V/A-type H+-transporting ATPase subunit D
MATIKFTKGELKKQRDSLKQFRRYLPTLQLKKQQLQMKILEVRRKIEEREKNYDKAVERINQWSGLLGDPSLGLTFMLSSENKESSSQQKKGNWDIAAWIIPVEVLTDTINVAGAKLPIFKDIRFIQPEYDFYLAPFWLDRAVEELRLLMTLRAEIEILQKQIKMLERELRITTQRVNLFEKVKIPECLDNIRKIRIYLGDQMANAVGISKVAKKKVEAKNQEMVLQFAG